MNKVRDEEAFAELAPELRTLARGWTWRVCEAIPGDRYTAHYIRSALFVMLMTAVFGILLTFLEKQGVASTASIAGAIVVSIFCGLIASALFAATSAEVRKAALQRKAERYSPEELQKLAASTLQTLRRILGTVTIDSETKNFIDGHSLDTEKIRAKLDLSIGRLRKDAEKTVEGLLSSDTKSKAAALSRLAASDAESLAGRIRRVREAQNSVRQNAEREVVEREAVERFEAIMNEHGSHGEATTEPVNTDTSADDIDRENTKPASHISPPEAPRAKAYPDIDATTEEKKVAPTGLRSPWSFPLAETILLILSVAIMVVFWVIADWQSDPEMVQRGGALALVLAAVAEHVAKDRQIKKIQSKTYGDVKINDPVIPEKTTAESIVFGAVILLVILGTVVWGFGDLFYKWITD